MSSQVIDLKADSAQLQTIPALKTARSRKAPSLKTAVIVRRSQGQDKTRISKDLGIARNTVTRILEENDVTRHLEANRGASLDLIPKAIQVAHDRLSKGSENMAIKVLENTIWPLNQKQGKPQDQGLVLAIGNLMGNVTVSSTSELKPLESAPICVNADTQKQIEQK